MSGATTLRAARYDLARQLLDHGIVQEAREQLVRALNEQGDDPADWKIHRALGQLELAVGERSRAVVLLLTAARSADADAISDIAEEALSALETGDGDVTTASLIDEDVRALLDRARAREASVPLVQLAVRLAFLRGEDDAARRLLESRRDDVLAGAPTLRAPAWVALAAGKIDEGKLGEALRLLDQAALGAHPDVAATRALALYADGRSKEALAALDDGESLSFDGAIVRTLVLLQDAVQERRGSDGPELFARALDAAALAARLEPTRPEAALLRAQVMLEGSFDQAEGRQLLRTAVRNLDGDLDKLRFWRLQQQVRDDDVHRYFLMEVAAAQQRDDEVLKLAARGSDAAMDNEQGAAFAELEARAWQRKGDAGRAAARFRDAAQSFERASDRSQAIHAYREALALATEPSTALNLVSLLWTSSFPVEDGGDGATSALDECLRLLDMVDATVTGADAVRASHLRGLTLVRRRAAGLDDERTPAWSPLPYLLAAALGDPTASYTAADLAWALQDVDLRRSARHFAEHALAVSRTHDQWLIETAVVMRFNWSGVIDERTAALLEEIAPGPWRSGVSAFHHLMAGDDAQLRDVIADVPDDKDWQRQIRAHAVARGEGFDAARPLFDRLLQDHLRRDKVEYVVQLAAIVGDLELARDLLSRFRHEGRRDPHSIRLDEAIVGVLDQVPGSSQAAADVLHEEIVPFALRAIVAVDVPTLMLSFGDTPAVVDELAQVRDYAQACLDAMADEPPLAAEVDEQRTWGLTEDTRGTLVRLLEATDLISRNDSVSASASLLPLSVEPEPYGAAFAQAVSTVIGGLDAEAS